MRKNVYLTGFMASGKSTVGPALSRRLKRPFVDLDEEIVRRTQKSIPALFREEGEPRFREVERLALHDVGNGAPQVIALGGGTLTSDENVRTCRSNGIVVYLRASPAILARRLSRSRTKRPMIEDESGRRLTGTELVKRIETLLLTRRAYYEQADITIDADRASVSRIVDDILQALARVEDV